MTNEQYNKATALVSEREIWFQRFKQTSELAIKYRGHDVITINIDRNKELLIKGEFLIEAIKSHMKFCTEKIDMLNEEMKQL